MRRFARMVGCALVAWMLSGCAAPPPPDGPPLPAATIDLLIKPRDIREDYAYPPSAMWQRFRWMDHGVDWQMRFPPRIYAYASIVFRKPHNFTAVLAATRITFRLEPGALARGLSVGLVDGDARPGRVMVDVPLTPPPAGHDICKVDLPLTAFPAEGSAVDVTDLDQAGGLRPFDWTDVRELRIISPGHVPRPLRDIRVTQLRFAR